MVFYQKKMKKKQKTFSDYIDRPFKSYIKQLQIELRMPNAPNTQHKNLYNL